MNIQQIYHFFELPSSFTLTQLEQAIEESNFSRHHDSRKILYTSKSLFCQ